MTTTKRQRIARKEAARDQFYANGGEARYAVPETDRAWRLQPKRK